MTEADHKLERMQELLARVRKGQLEPDLADEEADSAGLGSLSILPSPDDYWPASKPYWTLPMVLAWITWRTFSEVREWDAKYLSMRVDWGPRSGVVGRGAADGYELYRRKNPTTGQFLRWGHRQFGPWVVGDNGGPAVLPAAEPEDAMKILRHSLASGDLVAWGRRPGDAVHMDIPARECVELETIQRGDSPEELHCGRPPRPVVYQDVLFHSRSVLSLWPAHVASGIPDRAEFSLTPVIVDPEARAALYMRFDPTSPEVRPSRRPQRAARASLEGLFNELKEEQERLVSEGSPPWTERKTEDWGRSNRLTRDEIREFRNRLPPELKRQRGQSG